MPRSVLRESNGGNSFPISVVTAGLHPSCIAFTYPASRHLPPTGPTALLQTPCAIQGHITGAPFLPSNPFQAQALASGKSNPLVQTTPAHGQHCTGDNCSNQRNFADFPRVPEPSRAETTGWQQHISHTPGLSLGCYNCLSESPDLSLQGC